MLVAQPTLELPEAPYAAVVARPLSVWPFATRTLRLFLLIDPSLPDPTPRHGLLRAMQQAYFCSDGFSQTRAVREAALAAHYVLRHHNRDVLPLLHVNAATAVAAVRGDVAFVALAGDAAVFAWRDGVLSGQRGVLRLPRPLGLEQDPRITLWSTRLAPGDRLLLVCGATWQPESQRLIEDIFRDQPAAGQDEWLEKRLVAVLSGSRPAGVLLVDPSAGARSAHHLALVPPRDHGQGPPFAATARAAELTTPATRRQRAVGWVTRCLATLLVCAAVVAGVSLGSDGLPRLATFHQAQALLAQADETIDPYQAHALTASALELVQRGMPGAPADDVAQLAARATGKLDTVDHVYRVSPEMAVRLGPSGANVVDLTVGAEALYTLDVVEGTVRGFALDTRDQRPTPDTLVVRAGAPVGIGPGARQLAAPVAIQYLSGRRADDGVLAIVDQARTVVQVAHDRTLSPRAVASSAAWRELGALGTDPDGSLYVLDSASRQLLEYPSFGQRTGDPPRLLLDDRLAPGLPFERAAEIVAQQDDVYLRMDDGTLHRYDPAGQERPFVVRPPDGAPWSVSAVAPDRTGGLYLVDAAHARVLHTTGDGAVLRQLRDPALAGVRQIRSSLDGRRLYGLVTSGILVFDVPQVAVL